MPTLKNNLISLGTIESKKCSFLSEDGVLKVTKEVLILMKVTRVGNNLYRLPGDIALGGVAVSTEDKPMKMSLNCGICI